VGILISDKDYPLRVSYSLLTKILDDFSLRYPPSKFQSATKLDFDELHNVMSFDILIVVFDAVSGSKSGRYDDESTSRIG
jgi:hypothetical protein